MIDLRPSLLTRSMEQALLFVADGKARQAPSTSLRALMRRGLIEWQAVVGEAMPETRGYLVTNAGWAAAAYVQRARAEKKWRVQIGPGTYEVIVQDFAGEGKARVRLVS